MLFSSNNKQKTGRLCATLSSSPSAGHDYTGRIGFGIQHLESRKSLTMNCQSRLSEVWSLVCPVVWVVLTGWKWKKNLCQSHVVFRRKQWQSKGALVFSCLLFYQSSKEVKVCFVEIHVCDCRLSAVITSSAAPPRRTTVASAAGTVRPAGWCEDTTNPSMTLEKVNNPVLFFLWRKKELKGHPGGWLQYCLWATLPPCR